jgi:hypothetical protein
VAVRFSANGQDYSSTASPPATTFTVVCWARFASLPSNYQTVWSSDQPGGATYLELAMEPADSTIHVFNQSISSLTGLVVSAGTWYKTAVVLSGGTGTLYFAAAGQTLSTFSTGSFGAVTSPTLKIGNSGFNSDWLDGNVANFKHYSAVLTQTEIEAELNSWTAVRTANLVRHHKFQVAETTDYSGNGNTLSGGTGATTEADPTIPESGGGSSSAVTYVATSTPATNGTTTSATTVSITPTLPTGTASGDRVFVIQAGNNTSGTTPTSWTAAAKDIQVGPTGTAPGAGTGRRYLSVSYRDYDGAWTMPTFTLTSATQNTHAISVITLRKVSSATWDTPARSAAGNTGSAGTAYSVTTGSVVAPSGMVIVGTATNDNVTAAAESLTSSAMTFANLAERSDTGSATGNDVSIKSYTADVYSGGTGTITHAATLSAASEGGSIVVAQTSTASGPAFLPRHRGPQYRR